MEKRINMNAEGEGQIIYFCDRATTKLKVQNQPARCNFQIVGDRKSNYWLKAVKVWEGEGKFCVYGVGQCSTPPAHCSLWSSPRIAVTPLAHWKSYLGGGPRETKGDKSSGRDVYVGVSHCLGPQTFLDPTQ